jgi:hypothetical protein
MNSIFHQSPKKSFATQPVIVALALLFVFVTICAVSSAIQAQSPAGGDPASEFKHLTQQLSAARLSGADDDQAQMEKALAYLDAVALVDLNGSADPSLEAANRGFAGLVSRIPRLGENYRLVKLGGRPATYAVVINFGQGGPAAVRIYAGASGHYALAARIDHFAQMDFLDSDIELVPVSNAEPVFVTISGRTDDLSTGAFSAWRFDGHRVTALWNSDLLQQSNYESDADGFHLVYCSKVDDDRPSQCLKMSRDLYRFQDGEWKRAETADLPPQPASANH